MPKAWKIFPQHSEDLTEQLLYNRGIKEKAEIEQFFNPQLKDYEKDLQIPGIEAAKKRILQAVERKELIVIYGDYDADGVCATAVLYHGLTLIGAKVLPYIPHREKEGYGLSETGLIAAKEKGAKLVITVDNGIVAIEQAKYAKEIGLDLVITDHHTPVEEKPDCLALVHSTKICGAAVGWCLVRTLISQELAEELLDLVALATICDMVPLIGTNRALVSEGLKQLNKTPRVGLLALFYESKITPGKVDAYQVGHTLGPRINAIGRLEHAIDSVRLLCTKDKEKARKLARLLCEANDQKKQLSLEATIEAKEMIAQERGIHPNEQVQGKRILVLHSEKWIPGIIGLVAARVAEEYHLPTIILSRGEEVSKGSARSVNGLDIVETIRRCTDILIDVGGHPKAAGFTIATDKIDDFKKRLEGLVREVIFEDVDELEIEAEVSSSRLNKELIKELNKFEPTGVANPKPVLASKNMRITSIKAVGDGKHLKFKVADAELGRSADGIEAIAFSFGNLSSILKEGQLVSVAFNLEINQFNGNSTLQLKVLDLQFE